MLSLAVLCRLYEGRITQGSMRGTRVLFKVLVPLLILLRNTVTHVRLLSGTP